MKKTGLILLILGLALSVVLAQRRGGFGGRSGGRFGGGTSGEGGWISDDTRTAREVPSHSTGTPNWTNAPGFEKDVFTFVRVRRENHAAPARRPVPAPESKVSALPFSWIHLWVRRWRTGVRLRL